MLRARFVTFSLLSCAACTAVAMAEVKLPAIFSDHLVLQREQAIPVWGWAAAGEEIAVTLHGQTVKTKADPTGQWSLRLPAQEAGGPYELGVRGTNEITLSDVWVGEVWLCSGQSNMAMTVSRAQNVEAEQAAGNRPRIRQFKTGTAYSRQPKTDCKGEWTVCSSDTVGGFSATAYFFAREIEQRLDVPVGIINSSVGGTPIDSWISEAAQRESAALRPLFEQVDAQRNAFDPEQARTRYEQQLAKWKETAKAARAEGKQPPRAPQDPVAQFEKKANYGGLFNGMIVPVMDYGFRGALWYQGEANTTPEKAPYYAVQLPLLVQDWRARHDQGEFPFAWVQLPNFRGVGRNWPLVREAMFKAASLPETGVAVTIDVGERADIHPKNKQEVGRRLALWALADVYGRRVRRVPRPGKGHAVDGAMEVDLTSSDTAVVVESFEPSLAIAAIAGKDQQWHPAKIEVSGGRKLRFSSSEVAEPVAVRYLWANDPPAAPVRMANGVPISPITTPEVLPISPFRTDDWSQAEPFDFEGR
ncbi:MAG: sialate O-acetylesterase [Planctomycetaceae bacterium]